ncbi:vacuolar protein sorting-associated protein 35 [Lentinula raphanica]|uniref:Vacuolar protein sorting-associated protein 35 n=1 Tax=Lentinula raphanica TaxID=153919 RepID=A0AA38P9V0_9AGAR|nr:vacuolar protein sorting-associated protein 35 [Lentinula raphanica]KAJ3838974.1 vacuolar protein sorting-associated protein 35 [Lentinula raphanica]
MAMSEVPRSRDSCTSENDWQTKITTIVKSIRQLTTFLANQVEASTIAIRLFVLAAHITGECEDMTYNLYIQALSVYEDSIECDSQAQLQAIALIIATLNGEKGFGVDKRDTFITKAA